jgi:dihydroneopterin aldolase
MVGKESKSDLAAMHRMLISALALTLAAGCAPALTPLYRDYSDVKTDAEIYARIERALEAADWSVIEGPTENVVATEARTFRSWGIYSVEVQLEIAPMAGDHVRVFVNPYRHFFQGTRRKVPYLKKSLAKSALKDLAAAFEAEGLTAEGTAAQRDEHAGVK